MPKKIDPQVRERAVRLVLEHRAEHSSNQQAVVAVARQEGVGAESLRRWVIQAENKRLREDVAILKAATLDSNRQCDTLAYGGAHGQDRSTRPTRTRTSQSLGIVESRRLVQ